MPTEVHVFTIGHSSHPRAANGVVVLHIAPTGEVQPHTLTASAKVVAGTVTYPGQPTLFDLDT